MYCIYVTIVIVISNKHIVFIDMTKQARTKILRFGSSGMHIYIPADVRKDSLNPFKIGDEVVVSVDGKTLTVEMAGDGGG